MYGIVNKALEDLVKGNFGESKWNAILERSGIEEEFFISNEPYDDAITYKLAIAISEEIKMPMQEVMRSFGEWWVLRTGMEKYGGLMEAGGENLKKFLINLPIFHNRVMMIYTNITPPEFKVSHIESDSIRIHYISHREGLQDFVYGLLTGLGKMYHTPVQVKLIANRLLGDTHEVYQVNW